MTESKPKSRNFEIIRFLQLFLLPFNELQLFKTALLQILRAIGRSVLEILITRYKCQKIRKQLDKIESFQEYERLGLILDTLQGKEKWKVTKESYYYDYERIESRLENMRALRSAQDIKGLVHCLRQDLHKNLGGICHPMLYQCKVGTKKLIEEFHQETIACIQAIYYYSGSQINIQKKLEFFAETRHSYGHTALFLSGGAGLGKYHFGVVKALYEQDLMPKIIVGSSVGSLVASCICSFKYSHLFKAIDPTKGIVETFFEYKFNNFLELITKLFKGETILEQEPLKRAIRKYAGDMTFLEVFQTNHWNLNITVTDGNRSSDSRLLNYLTAPNVVVWSAAVASCAIPGFFSPVDLMIKTESGEIKPYYMSHIKGSFKFVDGSVACDLPINRMSELFNINTFIVSQVNPHVAPFIISDGFVQGQSRLRRKLKSKFNQVAGNEIRHWISQLTNLGLLPEYIRGIMEVVIQTYRGHVTIAPSLGLHDYRRLICNVEPERASHYIQHTYALTVQRVSHIRSLYGIEREFDRYYARLKRKIHCASNLRDDKDLIKFQINKALKEAELSSFPAQVFKAYSGSVSMSERVERDNDQLTLILTAKANHGSFENA